MSAYASHVSKRVSELSTSPDNPARKLTAESLSIHPLTQNDYIDDVGNNQKLNKDMYIYIVYIYMHMNTRIYICTYIKNKPLHNMLLCTAKKTTDES